MANERNPNDPYDANRLNRTDDDFNRAARLDNDLQPDPELAEGPASGGRIALAAVGIAVILGVVFYGLNSSSIKQAGTSAPTQSAQTQSSPPAAPPGMRDVTPHANTQPGVTTGSVPSHPQGAPASGPTGQEANQSGSTPANNAAPATNNMTPNK
jgi:hypothetical protein